MESYIVEYFFNMFIEFIGLHPPHPSVWAGWLTTKIKQNISFLKVCTQKQNFPQEVLTGLGLELYESLVGGYSRRQMPKIDKAPTKVFNQWDPALVRLWDGKKLSYLIHRDEIIWLNVRNILFMYMIVKGEGSHGFYIVYIRNCLHSWNETCHRKLHYYYGCWSLTPCKFALLYFFLLKHFLYFIRLDYPPFCILKCFKDLALSSSLWKGQLMALSSFLLPYGFIFFYLFLNVLEL